MKCPRCRGTNMSHNNLVVKVNTGAYFHCDTCGLELNEDGTENDVLLQPAWTKRVYRARYSTIKGCGLFTSTEPSHTIWTFSPEKACGLVPAKATLVAVEYREEGICEDYQKVPATSA